MCMSLTVTGVVKCNVKDDFVFNVFYVPRLVTEAISCCPYVAIIVSIGIVHVFCVKMLSLCLSDSV